MTPPTDCDRRAPKGGCDRRGGLDYFLRQQSARCAGAKLPRAHQGCARNRIATRDSFARLPMSKWLASCERKAGRAPSPRFCIASPADANWRCRHRARALCLLPGILTFKNSDALREIAAALPADRIMVETDAPYLAPLPYRGKRNEPAFVTETAKVLAQTRGVSDEEIARQTTENFFRLFNKVPRNLADAA